MEKKEVLLRRILTAATVLLLVLLAWQCLDIYLDGNSPANLDEKGLYIHTVYRAEDVTVRLSGLRIWAMGYLVLLIAVSLLLPEEGRKGNGVPLAPDNRLRTMKKKLAELPEAACREETLRKKIRYGTAAAMTVCAAMSLSYLLNRDNFNSWDLETVMGLMLVHTLPWILAAFGAAIGAAFICRRSMEREIGLLKGITGNPVPEAASPKSRLNYVRIFLYILAAVLIVDGISNGGMRDVLVKAINICTECIGLG